MKSALLTVALALPCAAQQGSLVDYLSQVKNRPNVMGDNNRAYADLAAACADAVTFKATLSISKIWRSQQTQSCAANVQFDGGIIQPASGQTVTFTGSMTAGLVQAFDLSLGGTVVPGATPLYYPQWWGAKGDNSHDDSVGLQACVNASRTVGGVCYLSPGNYRAHITLPVGSTTDSPIVTLAGAPSYGPLDTSGVSYGSNIICPAASTAATCIKATLPLGSVKYVFRDLAIIGAGNTSGNGVVVCCKAIVAGDGGGSIVDMNNVKIKNFLGTGMSALALDGSEDGLLQNVDLSYNYYGFRFTTAFNANTVVNLSCQYATSDCGYFTNSDGITWEGGLFQANPQTGLRIKGMTNSVFNGTWFEGNNSSVTAGQAALILDSRGANYNEQITFQGVRFGATNDRVIGIGDGTAQSVYVSFLNSLPIGPPEPQVTVDSSANYWKFVNTLGTCAGITDGGAYNTVENGPFISACDNNPIRIFSGKVGLGIAAPVAPLHLLEGASSGVSPVNTDFIRLSPKINGVDSTSYGYIRDYYDAGIGGPVIGGSFFNGSAEVDLISTDTRYPWIALGGVLRLKTYHFAQIASFGGNQTQVGVVFLCDDCTKASPCAGGGSGAIAKRLNLFGWDCN